MFLFKKKVSADVFFTSMKRGAMMLGYFAALRFVAHWVMPQLESR